LPHKQQIYGIRLAAGVVMLTLLPSYREVI
jgi:hypothetical protein